MKNRFLPCSHKAISAMALLASLVMLGGCFGDDENWNGKDISGLMPELAFELTGTSGDTVTVDWPPEWVTIGVYQPVPARAIQPLPLFETA